VGGDEVTYLLDTACWLRGYAEPKTIPIREQRILSSNQLFGISAISLWEVGKKNQKGKLDLHASLPDWFQRAIAENIQILPITPEVVIDAMRLPEFPTKDPGDELIVATARVYDLTLITTDTALRNYRHARIHYFTPILENSD
jgi:PIN domain nuclease of toxin-antitoxin system